MTAVARRPHLQELALAAAGRGQGCLACGSLLWQGKKGTGWRGSFDDILSKSKFRRLMEGGYADAPVPAAPVQESAGQRLIRERDEMRAAASRTIDGFAS